MGDYVFFDNEDWTENERCCLCHKFFEECDCSQEDLDDYEVVKFINPYRQFQGIWLPMWLLQMEELSLTDKIIYAVLAKHAGENGCCYPKQETIATALKTSTRTVKASIKKLIETNLIWRKQVGLRMPNVYFFLEHSAMGTTNRPPEVQKIALPDVKSAALREVIISALPYRSEKEEMNKDNVESPNGHSNHTPEKLKKKKDQQEEIDEGWYRAADYAIKQIKVTHPHLSLNGSTREKAAHDFEKLKRIDGKTQRELKEVLDWLPDALIDERSGFTWKQQVQSPLKFRKRDKDGVLYFDKLYAAMKKEQKFY